MSNLAAEKLTSMGKSPDWGQLENYQAQVTFSDFRWLLESQYAPNEAANEWIEIFPTHALIKRFTGDSEPFKLRFRPIDEAPSASPRYWQSRNELIDDQPDKPLGGIVVALDPGHIGGDFAAMEHRSWKTDDGPLFREGDFVLEVAQRLKPRLEALGATVNLVRSEPKPVTTDTPDTLRPRAAELIAEKDALTPGLDIQIEDQEKRITALANLLFYRVSEIRARARIVNEDIQPDLVLCLHVDATHFPKDRSLAERGYAHYLINGAYSKNELSFDDQRLQMLIKLLNRSWEEERGLANAFTKSFRQINDLPPHVYTGSNAIRVDENPYVWARNLMANRLFECPTVFLEPCVANADDFYLRLGDDRDALLEEYAEGVISGLLSYYAK
ncbi:MAG: N-acetylmuramoyl-L-alanine amidase [Verrucomicrobiota bacterium]